MEPVSVAVHATARAGEMGGKNVVVLGAGPIGNLVGQMCRARGANVLITDVSSFRVEKAGECGIEQTSNSVEESLADRRGFAVPPLIVTVEESKVSIMDRTLPPLIVTVEES